MLKAQQAGQVKAKAIYHRPWLGQSIPCEVLEYGEKFDIGGYRKTAVVTFTDDERFTVWADQLEVIK